VRTARPPAAENTMDSPTLSTKADPGAKEPVHSTKRPFSHTPRILPALVRGD